MSKSNKGGGSAPKTPGGAAPEASPVDLVRDLAAQFSAQVADLKEAAKVASESAAAALLDRVRQVEEQVAALKASVVDTTASHVASEERASG